MASTALTGNGKRLALLLLLAILAGLVLTSPPADAVHRGCVATAPGFPDDCSFISPGGRILATAVATSYVVTVLRPDGSYLVCLDGAYVPAVNICDTTPGSKVFVFARVGITSARLMDV